MSAAPAAGPQPLASHAPGLRTEVLALAVFCAFLFFFGLGSFGLVGADEPRYAQIAREMLARHDWVVPVLNGKPWLEKPALYYWSAMLSYSVFGVGDWAARLPSALMATGMIAAIYAFMLRFRRGSQLNAALITASCAATIGFARGASTDMPLAATFTIAMLGWFAWQETGRKLWLAGFYLFLALATLAKGPVAPVLATGTLLPFALLHRDSGVIRRTLWWPGLLLFAAVALPWYVLVELRTGEFFRVFIIEHNLGRFGTNMFRHKQPTWYYVPVLVLGLLPWTVFALAAAGKAVARVRARAGDTLSQFLLLWAAVPLIFFSMAESKLPGYILPAIPALTMLLADYLRRPEQERQRPGWSFTLLHGLGASAVLAAAILAPAMVLRARPTFTVIAAAAVAGAVVLAGIVVTLRVQGWRALRLVTLVPVILGLAFVLRVGAPAVDAAESARPVASELDRIDSHHGEVALFRVRREVEYGLDFYRNRPTRNYARGEVPEEDHLLVSRRGSVDELKALLPGRRFSHVGEFAPQRLDIFWVSTRHEHPAAHSH